MYQDAINKKFGTDFNIPVVFYSQLMAVAFGMDREKTPRSSATRSARKSSKAWPRRSSAAARSAEIHPQQLLGGAQLAHGADRVSGRDTPKNSGASPCSKILLK